MTTIKILNNGTPVPIYATAGAAAFDVVSAEDYMLQGRTIYIIPTGLIMEIPKGFELQIRSRSELAWNSHVMMYNSPSTIDSDYRGEIKVMLCNNTVNPFQITKGDRIAQGVFAPVIQAQFELVDALDDTERGARGA